MGWINFLEERMLPCAWKELGVECAGCGLQRSLILLLRGDFYGALIMYPAIYSLFFMFGFMALHLKFNFQKGAQILKWLFITNLLIIFFHFISKQF